MVPWNSSRTKVQIKLSIQRLRTLQEKKHALAKKSRREIADLLLKGRVETARLRVEGLIGDDIYVELLELLELYSEMLQARFNLLDASSGTEPEPSISDAVCAIVYAAPRTELKELQILREMLMHKYGRAFALPFTAPEPPSSVPARVASKLALYTPGRELVDAYLYEIAKGYNVDWEPEPPSTTDESTDTSITTRDESKGNGDKQDEIPNQNDENLGGKGKSPSKDEGLLDKNISQTAKEISSGLPDTPTYPAGQEKDAWAGSTPPGTSPGKKLSAEEELAQRFERLKKLK